MRKNHLAPWTCTGIQQTENVIIQVEQDVHAQRARGQGQMDEARHGEMGLYAVHADVRQAH